MKAKNIILTIALILISAGTGLAGDMDLNEERPYIGVMLDGSPLPDLLVKHLALEPGQGIRIANIHCGSPADKAGLERDDLIIGLEDGIVDDQQQFVDNVRKAGIGQRTTRVNAECLFEILRGSKQVGRRSPIPVKPAPQVEVVRFGIDQPGLPESGFLFRRQLCLNLLGYRACDVRVQS